MDNDRCPAVMGQQKFAHDNILLMMIAVKIKMTKNIKLTLQVFLFIFKGLFIKKIDK